MNLLALAEKIENSDFNWHVSILVDALYPGIKHDEIAEKFKLVKSAKESIDAVEKLRAERDAEEAAKEGQAE